MSNMFFGIMAFPSPSGEFAFGFQKNGNGGGFLLAIWFDKIPEKTIVWSAINGKLVQKGSTVELTADGRLLLNNTVGGSISIWDDQPAASGVAYAAMLDTGNFVLANRSSFNLWESFQHPTDTILPTQILHPGNSLFARHLLTNYSKGRFMFKLESNGTPVLYTTNFPFDSPNSHYWSIQTVGNYQVFFNPCGFIYLTDSEQNRVEDIVPPTRESLKDSYQRATLDYNGVLMHYIYQKTNGRLWYGVASSPINICTAVVETTGGGACGFNGLCVLGDQGPTCECPMVTR
ncbi:G-type lectin S-receptor-like serine/threonine-protein kinase RLK1 [Pyrus ussuriensis x Pyrus communis]|uniref:G-type lectin S-receptor-like serine/threonine-protein kinase RLK1 n=1 Tax=Pyrus ussuriensis x Pyrus communis TaxID=2448454 RepID=A0A5N5G9N7_9ROSA|nr:G-type lectin S-receptor-like serine/threonine-protein kinase RLK1 [Pyrus ussuriensis x Pyrus communis]